MPRISEVILNASFFLYPSEAAAARGWGDCGSGFFIGYPARRPGQVYPFAVTNDHVVKPREELWLRTGPADSPTVQRIQREEWMAHPEDDDLAFWSCSEGLREYFNSVKSMVDYSLLMTRDLAARFQVGPGDEIVSVAQWPLLPGAIPTMRFGQISAMPQKPHQDGRGFDQVSYLVEFRSTNGCSGSPVFVYSPFPRFGDDQRITAPPMLLGVIWGHYESSVRVFGEAGRDESLVGRSNSNLAYVIPAWRICGFFEGEEMRAALKEIDDAWEMPEGMNVMDGS